MARLNYNHLRYFWAVAHNGNLSRAAEQLHVSQSALSVQIRKLEEQLGHALFERRGRQLVLTEAGRIALDHADAIFETGEQLLGTMQEQSRARAVLRVGALSTLSRNFQLRFLQPLLGRDDVEVVVRSGSLGELLGQLEAHRLDVVLSNLAPARDAASPWVIHELDAQRIGLVAFPGRVPPDATLEQILGEMPLLVPTLETSIRGAFDALCDRLGLVPNFVAEVDDMALLRVLARQDVGVAVVPPIVVRDELASGMLVELAQLPDFVERFLAVTPVRRFPNPLLRELVTAEPLKE